VDTDPIIIERVGAEAGGLVSVDRLPRLPRRVLLAGLAGLAGLAHHARISAAMAFWYLVLVQIVDSWCNMRPRRGDTKIQKALMNRHILPNLGHIDIPLCWWLIHRNLP
jgi:hypothetical protein